MLPIITAHTPAGTSTYTIIHYMQEYGSSMFTFYLKAVTELGFEIR